MLMFVKGEGLRVIALTIFHDFVTEDKQKDGLQTFCQEDILSDVF